MSYLKPHLHREASLNIQLTGGNLAFAIGEVLYIYWDQRNVGGEGFESDHRRDGLKTYQC